MPDTAGPLEITADLKSRSVEYKIRLMAPRNRRSTTARVNWLLRQIKSTDSSNLHIRAIRPGSSRNTMKPLAELNIYSSGLAFSKNDIPATALEVVKVIDLAGKFSGNKKFVEELFSLTIKFSEELDKKIESNLDNWTVDRLNVIDRLIMKMSLCEMIHLKSYDISHKVTISSAIENAKKFSSEDSTSFVNGVLDSIYKEL